MSDFVANASGFLSLFGTCETPGEPDAIASGSFALHGACSHETVTPNNVEAAAAGRIDLFGPCVADEDSDEYAAVGGLGFGGGVCSYETLFPEPYVASGNFILTGSCSYVGSKPCLPACHYAASGSLNLSGPCAHETNTQGTSYAASAKGGFVISGRPLAATATPEEAGLVCVARGGLEISGPCVADTPALRVVKAAVANVGAGASCLLLSSNCAGATLYPPADTYKAQGGLVFVTPDVNALVQEEFAELFETWALTGQAYEPGFFTGFNFNSYCVYRGRAYGAKEDGIYLLEGEDDDGQEIHDGVRIGPHNWGIEREKRLRALRLGVDGTPTVRIAAGIQEDIFDSDTFGRVSVSRNLQGKEFVIDIADFEQLDQLEIVPLVLFKR